MSPRDPAATLEKPALDELRRARQEEAASLRTPEMRAGWNRLRRGQQSAVRSPRHRMPEYPLSITEVAALTGLEEPTLQRHVDHNTIPHLLLNGETVFESLGLIRAFGIANRRARHAC